MDESEQILRKLIKPLRSIDWNDITKTHLITSKILFNIKENKEILGGLVGTLSNREACFKRCEKDYNIDKFVLYNDEETSIRLRLHIMHPYTGDIPHSHRMNFTSLILYGSYLHTMYAPIDCGEVLYEADEIFPILIRNETTDNPYYIHHSLIHNLKATEGECISLMLRSPAQKKRAIHYDIDRKKVWWRYGSYERTEESKLNTKEVTKQDVMALEKKLVELDLI